MWPIKYELSIMIKLDVANYIQALKKEVKLDEPIQNIDKKLELIIYELISSCPMFINSCHLINIFECLDFIQNDELKYSFIKSDSFCHFYKLFHNEINTKFYHMIKESDTSMLQQFIFNILRPHECFQSRIYLTRLFHNDGRDDVAY